MLKGATPRAEEMAGTAVLRIVVSSDSMKKAKATSHGRSRLDASEGSDEDGVAINGPARFICRKLRESSPPRTSYVMSPTHGFLCAGVPLAANPQLGSSRVPESSGSAQCAVLKVNASVCKLLSAIKAHLISPARNREWTAHVVMPAAKEPLDDGL